MNNLNYKQKYFKYKQKYINIKNQNAGEKPDDFSISKLKTQNRYAELDISPEPVGFHKLDYNEIVLIINQIDHWNGIFNLAASNNELRKIIKGELPYFYPKLKEKNPILPYIQNIKWEQFLDLCRMLDKGKSFLNTTDNRMNRVPVRNNFINMEYDKINLDFIEDFDSDDGELTLTGYTKFERPIPFNESDLELFYSLLLYSPHIKTIKLSNNSLINIRPLATALLNNINLEELNLSNVGAYDISPLATAFKNNPNFKSLNLSDNRIESIKPLLNAFNNNFNLEELNLSNNNIIKIRSLSKTLRNNRKLEILDLSDNPFEHITLLSEILQNNTLLKILNITNRYHSERDIGDIEPLKRILKETTKNPELYIQKIIYNL